MQSYKTKETENFRSLFHTYNYEQIFNISPVYLTGSGSNEAQVFCLTINYYKLVYNRHFRFFIKNVNFVRVKRNIDFIAVFRG